MERIQSSNVRIQQPLLEEIEYDRSETLDLGFQVRPQSIDRQIKEISKKAQVSKPKTIKEARIEQLEEQKSKADCTSLTSVIGKTVFRITGGSAFLGGIGYYTYQLSNTLALNPELALECAGISLAGAVVGIVGNYICTKRQERSERLAEMSDRCLTNLKNNFSEELNKPINK